MRAFWSNLGSFVYASSYLRVFGAEIHNLLNLMDIMALILRKGLSDMWKRKHFHRRNRDYV